MFKNLWENYGKLSTSKKIGLSVTINMVIMVLMISCALYIEFINVKNSQEELPGSFFATYHQESLEEVSMRAKQLILTLVDYRVPFISTVTNLLVDHSNQTIEHNIKELRPENTAEHANKVMCVRSQNRTIFSCDMDEMSRNFMEGGWPYHSQRRIKNARRFSIVYQNSEDKSDIMIFTISETQDLEIKNIDRISSQMDGIKDGLLEFSSFYTDQYGSLGEQLVSFHTVKTFAKYRVLVEIETFGGFIKGSISRVIYSDDTNVVVITKNETQTNGYSLVTNLKALSPNIEYKTLLEPGHRETVLLDGQIIYSYTIKISSVYKIGRVSLAESENMNEDYSLIIHTPSISLKAETRTYEIINNLKQKLFEFLTTFSFCLFLLLGANVLRLANQINRKLKIIQESMKKYSNNPSNYHQTTNELDDESQNEYWFGSVMNAISETIKWIECNKRKFRQKCEKRNKDEFPLNLLEPTFVKQEGWKEFEKFDKLIERLECSSPVGRDLKTIKEHHEEFKKDKGFYVNKKK